MTNIVQTQSATPLDKVSVVPDPSGMVTHVWLRTNISTESRENLTGEGDNPQTCYVADELYVVLPGVCSVESIEDQFDTLWPQYGETRSIEDRLTNLEEIVNSVAAATIGLAE